MRLELLGRLDRYIGGLFLASYATALLLIVGLVLIMDLASNLSYFEVWDDGTRVPTSTLVRYYVLNVPFLFLQVAPFITVVAGLFTVARLLKKNELVAALSAGVSAHRLLAPVLLGGVLAAGAMFVLRESLTRVLGPRRDALHDILENHRYERVFTSLWFRDRANNVVSLAEYRPESQTIRGIEATVSERGVWTRIHAPWAERARKPDGNWGWRLENGVREDVDNEAMRPREIGWLEVIEFTPEDILTAHKGRERELELSFSEVIQLASRDPFRHALPDPAAIPPDLPAGQRGAAAGGPALPGRSRARPRDGGAGGGLPDVRGLLLLRLHLPLAGRGRHADALDGRLAAAAGVREPGRGPGPHHA